MDDIKKNFFLIIKHNFIALQAISENYEILINEEIFFNNSNFESEENSIKKFLNEHIFKIEKKFNLYIEEIYLIIEHKKFLTVDVSLIKDFKYLSNKFDNISSDLSNIKENILKTNIDYELVHMMIKKFIIDNKDYSMLPDLKKQKSLFLEINLICFEKKAVVDYKKILSEYQISIKKIFNYEYVNSFKIDGADKISVLANKLINGLNKNEINLTEKFTKNIGFFEKFFKFFS